MAYITCNASKYFYNKMDAASAKTYCDRYGNSAVKEMVEEYPSMCVELADLGWRIGQDFRYDADVGLTADQLKDRLNEMSVIAAHRCFYSGICDFPDANSFWMAVGLQNDSQQALAMTIVFGACPNSGQSIYADNFTINKCYITGDFSDDTGRGEYSDKCYWSAD